MVLLVADAAPVAAQAPPESTLARWHAEVCKYEQEHDGFVARGGRWLQRLERAREGEWLRSFSDPERALAMQQLPAEHRRLHAAIHHVEEGLSPSDRAILRRSALSERVDMLCSRCVHATLVSLVLCV